VQNKFDILNISSTKSTKSSDGNGENGVTATTTTNVVLPLGCVAQAVAFADNFFCAVAVLCALCVLCGKISLAFGRFQTAPESCTMRDRIFEFRSCGNG
jgi:hypothetical protein